MKNFFGILVLMLFLLLSVSVSFADITADDKAIMDTLIATVDAGEMTIEQALASAIEQWVSFSAIVTACKSHGIPLSNIITAAATVGISSEVALAKMADAGVSKEQMSAAINQASGQGDSGLGYTQTQPTVKVAPVKPVTSNPGGTAQGGTVSPSTL